MASEIRNHDETNCNECQEADMKIREQMFRKAAHKLRIKYNDELLALQIQWQIN